MGDGIDVLYLTRYGRQGASSRYRSFQFAESLQRHGIRCSYGPLLGDDYLASRYGKGRGRLSDIATGFLRRLRDLLRVHRYDVVVVEKELLPYFPATLERLMRACGIPYVVDYDDATFHAYDRSPKKIVRTLLRYKIAEVMRNASCVIVGNQYLAEYARGSGARSIAVLPTVVDLGRYSLAPSRPDEVFTIGWIGSPGSSRFLNVAAGALADACRDGRARLVLVGAGNDALPGLQAERRPWSEGKEVRDLQDFDVGIMPIPDEHWTRGKCGLKLIQYMACGLPVIASPVGMNVEIVEPGVNGLLPTTDAEWIRALEFLRNDAQVRRRMGLAGRRKVEQQYCTTAIVPQLASILRSAAQ